MSGSVDTNAPVAQAPVLPPPSRSPFDGPNSWSNLMVLGGDMTNATNARTSGGFLANPGMSAFTAGLGALPGHVQSLDIQGQQAADAARAAADASTQAGATVQGTLLENEHNRLANLLTASSIPYLQERQKQQIKALQAGDPTEPTDATGTSTNAPSGQQSANDLPPSSNTAITDPAIKQRIIDKALAANGMTGKIDPAVVDGLIQTESSWRPGVRVASTITKPDGTVVPTNSTAYGLGQTEKSTAENPGMGIQPVDYKSLSDPQTAANFAVAQLKGIGQSKYHLTTPEDWNNPGNLASVLSSYHGPQDAFGTTGQAFATGVMSKALTTMAARTKAQQQSSSGGQPNSPQTAQAMPVPPIPPADGGNEQQAQAMPVPPIPPTDPAQVASNTQPTSMRPNGPDPSTLPTPSFQSPDQASQADDTLPTKPYQVASADATIPVPSNPNQPGMNIAPDKVAVPAPVPTPAPVQTAQATPTPPNGGERDTASGGPQALPLPKGYISPQLAMQKAQYFEQLAERRSLLGGATAGFDPAPAATAAQQWRAYATGLMEKQASPFDLRGEGSMHGAPGEVPVQTPISKEVLSPDDNRKYKITQLTYDNGTPQQTPKSITDKYPWVPAGTQSIALAEQAPGEKSSQVDSANDAFGAEANKAYQGAQTSIMSLDNLQHQMDKVNATPGFWNSGAFGEEKAKLGVTLNSLAGAIGISPPIDPSKPAALEAWLKDMKTNGIQTTRTLGAHEAASVVTMVMSAQPTLENSPLGAQMVKNGLYEANKYLIDRHNFNISWASNPNAYGIPHNPNDQRQADAAFAQLYSPSAYAKRAISQTEPVTVKNPQDAAKLMPGTAITLPDGGKGMVPYTGNFTPEGFLKLDLAPQGGTAANGR